MQGIPTPLQADYEQCAKIARDHYENFPVASLLLPASQRPHVAALYAFARIADDFSDEPLHEGNRLVELDRWERDFRLALEGKPSNPVARSLAHSVRAFGIDPELPLKLLKAFRMDVEVKRWKDWDSIVDYSQHSASPIGRCMLAFAGVQEERLSLLSDKVCVGLQLINFWQDTSLDLSRGRIYYPKEEWKAAKLKESDFRPGGDDPRTQALVQKMVDRTEDTFRSGFPLADEVPPFLGRELRAIFAGSLAILRHIREMDYKVFSRRPRLSALDKARVAYAGLLGRTPSAVRGTP
jgi:squalene synthase HpnC